MSKEPIAHFEAASTLAVVVSSNEPLLFPFPKPKGYCSQYIVLPDL
jgi:hypothetical protein